MAGESARATAHSRRVKAERLLQSAEAFERGAEGEESTASVLGVLSHDGWRVFHDVRWPGRAQANIDHVVVGPSGVFVIDTKAWTGNVEIKSGTLRQDGKRRSRHVIASSAAAMAVGELLPGIDPKVIHPVICFARPEPIFGWSGDVMVCSTENVVTFLSSKPRGLDESQMTDIAEALAVSLDCAGAALPPPVATHAADAPAAPTAPVARRRAHERKLPRPPLPEPVRVLAKIGIVAVLAALAFQLDLPAKIGDLGASALNRVVTPTQPIGTSVAAPGLGDRPPLEVTAGNPVTTRSTMPGVHVSKGNVLVAVPVSVRNVGDETWSSHEDVHAEVTDTYGSTFSGDPAYAKVSAGAALPGTLELPARAKTSGLVVFEVPRGTEVTKFRLKVGPGLPTTLRWSVE